MWVSLNNLREGGNRGGRKGGGDVESVREKTGEGKWPHPVQKSALLGTRIARVLCTYRELVVVVFLWFISF